MIALLLVLGLFAGWWTMGLGLLAAVRADTGSLRIVLTSPAIGGAVNVLVLFVFSHAGVGIAGCAVPIWIVLLIAALAAIAWRRPRVHRAVVPVLGVCLMATLLVGAPLLTFGFHWIANANDDMANYVLSATQLLHHGLLAPIDVAGLRESRDFATLTQGLHGAGARPGADLVLASVSALTGRLPWQVFMPVMVAFNLIGVCAAGALAMQAARRWWAAVVAAGLLAVSPLAAYGVAQQLMPQVWGLGLAAALLALVMRGELYRDPGPGLRDTAPIAILAAALFLVYSELASTLAVAFILYILVLAVRRELSRRAIVRVLVPILVLAVVVFNAYLLQQIAFIHAQASTGLSHSGGQTRFPYSLVPEALATVTGLEAFPQAGAVLGTDVSILLSFALLAVALVASVRSAWRGVAAAVVLVTDAMLAAVLAHQGSAFGLFKLYMYAQPFLAAAVAIWVTGWEHRRGRVVGGVAVATLMALALPAELVIVDASRHASDLPLASSSQLLPAFQRIDAEAHIPVVSVTENPVLQKLEAASVGARPLYFVSANTIVSLYRSAMPAADSPLARQLRNAYAAMRWPQATFHLLDSAGPSTDMFDDNPVASRLLAAGRCLIVLAGGSELPVNRRSLPDGSLPLPVRECGSATNLLVFTNSTLGSGFYDFRGHEIALTLFQLEKDPFVPGRTMSGVGRYLLFRVLGPTAGMRLAVDLTATLNHDGGNLLPPAAVVGARRWALPVLGRGSARVFSPPLRPQMIDGQPFLVLDLGRDGRPARENRTGIQGLYSSTAPLDPRYLVGYLRDVSLVSATQSAHLRRPEAITSFPAGLADPDLEYSGIYEDGWMGGDGYAVLAGGAAADLRVRAQIPAGAGGHLQLLVNERAVYSAAARPGTLDVRVPVGASTSPRRLELRFAKTIRLSPPDGRPAAAQLAFVGFVTP